MSWVFKCRLNRECIEETMSEKIEMEYAVVNVEFRGISLFTGPKIWPSPMVKRTSPMNRTRNPSTKPLLLLS
jgi:hypothetical protein